MMNDRKEFDSAYKYLFSNKVIFHQFLTRFVNEKFAKKIALKDIEPVDKSFISDEFLKRESDIIYKVKLDHQEIFIYVLIEFQSTVDKTIPVRMLLYILQFYDQIYRNSQKGELPAIFPILLYNGSDKWNVPVNISELIEQTIPSKYIPSFHYYPVIENEIPDKVLLKLKGLVAAIIFLEKRKDQEAMINAVDSVINLIQEEKPEELRMFTNWLNRMFHNVLTEEDTQKISKLTEVKSMLAQVVHDIEAKGMKKGIHQTQSNTVQKMKSKGYTLEEIADITGLTKEEIEKLK